MGLIKAWIFRKDKHRCRLCGRRLTVSEMTFYGTTCEKCERKLMKKFRNA